MEALVEKTGKLSNLIIKNLEKIKTSWTKLGLLEPSG
jgi:hypothetical protein